MSEVVGLAGLVNSKGYLASGCGSSGTWCIQALRRSGTHSVDEHGCRGTWCYCGLQVLAENHIGGSRTNLKTNLAKIPKMALAFLVRRHGSGRSRSWRPCGSRELMAYSSSKARNGTETSGADGGGAGASREQGRGEADGLAGHGRRWARGGASGRREEVERRGTRTRQVREEAVEAGSEADGRGSGRWVEGLGRRRGLGAAPARGLRPRGRSRAERRCSVAGRRCNRAAAREKTRGRG